jgi:hypothetical protein
MLDWYIFKLGSSARVMEGEMVKTAKEKLKPVDNADIFTVLDRMDYAISQLHPKKEQTVMLVNQVRLSTDEFSRLLKNRTGSHNSSNASKKGG